MKTDNKKVTIRPAGKMKILSYKEANQLSDTSDKGLNDLFRNCSLAVLNTGSKEDDCEILLNEHKSFGISIEVDGRGVQLVIENPPKHAFVDGEIMTGLQEHLSSVLRDLLYAKNKIMDSPRFDLTTSHDLTNSIFHFARNADLMLAEKDPNLVVCWGGHSISLEEYKYTKHVGYELGLRLFDICTGCGPGAMKGPMKGAVLGHGKQRSYAPRFIGLTEPEIIAAEAPNAIVSELAIFPDIEKRLEAFVRLGHAIVVFPGGAGTMEEILYILSILLHPKNKHVPFSVILTAPETSKDYFSAVLQFITDALGEKASNKLKLIINNPREVAEEIKKGIKTVRDFRKVTKDSYYFNWNLHIPIELQQPFLPTHENVAKLEINRGLSTYQLASNLRKMFSAIVAGNVKSETVAKIREQGVFKISGDSEIMHHIDELLKSFSKQRRMKLGTDNYIPCYEINKK